MAAADGFVNGFMGSNGGGLGQVMNYVSRNRDRQAQREMQKEQLGFDREALATNAAVNIAGQNSAERSQDRVSTSNETIAAGGEETARRGNDQLHEARMATEARAGENDLLSRRLAENADRRNGDRFNFDLAKDSEEYGQKNDKEVGDALMAEVVRLGGEEAALKDPGFRQMVVDFANTDPRNIAAIGKVSKLGSDAMLVPLDGTDQYILAGTSTINGGPAPFTAGGKEFKKNSDTDGVVTFDPTEIFGQMKARHARANGATNAQIELALDTGGEQQPGWLDALLDPVASLERSRAITANPANNVNFRNAVAAQGVDDRTADAAAGLGIGAQQSGFAIGEKGANADQRRTFADRTDQNPNRVAQADRLEEAQGAERDIGQWGESINNVYSKVDLNKKVGVFDGHYESLRVSDDPAQNYEAAKRDAFTTLQDPRNVEMIATEMGFPPDSSKWTAEQKEAAVSIVALSRKSDLINTGFTKPGFRGQSTLGSITAAGIKAYKEGQNVSNANKSRGFFE